MSLDVPAIAAAYDAVRSDADPVNWLIIGDEISKTGSGKATDKMALQATGSGGLAEMADRLDDAQAQYGYVRVQYANDSESTRVKFVLIVWIGEQTRIMRKARVSVETGAVRAVLRHHSIQVDARDRADLAEDDIVVRLRKAGGADYNGGRG